ncbi:MAG: hypothetical protein K1X39_02520 [Thermoflexales bacterium]|nr:hypothetical protein [Thermoflexales bacterium]
MNANQVKLLKETFKTIEPMADETGELLYTKLFEIDPSLRPLFKGDIKAQGRMVFTAIGLAIAGLDKPEAMNDQVRSLGSRHVNYGVQPRDVNTFGAAFLWALEQTLGPAFTPEVKDAWISAYGVLSVAMRRATA